MADETSLSGLVLPMDPLTPLEAATMQYVDARSPLLLNDLNHYGDYWSTMPRALSTALRSLALGVPLYCSGMASDTFTATKLRVFSGAAAAGTGTFRASVYTGTALTALSLRASITTATAVAGGTLLEYALSASVAVTPGLIVCAGFLAQGFSTVPTFQCANGSGGPAGFISPSGRQWVATGPASSTTLASSLSMAALTAHGNPMWCSLAP